MIKFRNKLKAYWRLKSNYGIPENLSAADRQREVVTNEIVILVSVTSLTAIASYLIGNLIVPFPIAYFYSILLMFLTVSLNFYFRPYLSANLFKSIFYLSIITEIFIISLFAGQQVNVHLILAGSLVAPFVTLRKSNVKLLFLGVVGNIVLTIVVVFYFNNFKPLYPLHGSALQLMQGIILLFYLVPVIGFGYFVWRGTNDLEKFLEEEKHKSDMLLKNILPDKIANELKENGEVEPTFFKSTSVLFTDFVGFTQISANMTPQNLVKELHLCFSYFDSVMKKNKMEKLKTIGDAYMAVGGVPIENTSHCIDAIMAGFEIREIIKYVQSQHEDNNKPMWQVRIGIHAGPIVAGIIGEEKFAYDVWGETVNTAARLEGAGESGEINISRTVYLKIKKYFDCEYRGKVEVKSLGKIDMYFVKSLKKKYCNSTEVISPNQRFLEEYKKLSLVN